jgi:hypothetical protein
LTTSPVSDKIKISETKEVSLRESKMSGLRKASALFFLRGKSDKLVVPFLIFLAIYRFAPPADAKYGGGTGEPNDPYQIATAEDLMLLGETTEDYDKHFIMTADIDLDPNLPDRKVFDRAVIAPDTNDVSDPWGWNRFDGAPFTGVLDGNGHTLSHLTIRGTGYLGLFGQLDSESAISCIGLEDVDVNGNGDDVGGLVGRNSYYCTITNCYVKGGNVVGKANVSGLVGNNGYGIITDCYSSVNVSGRNSGGLVGYNSGSITNCYTTGSILGDNSGGLVGKNDGLVKDSFWDTQTSGQTTSDGGTGKTTAEMQDPNTFIDAGWDFVGAHDGPHDIWAEPVGGGSLILWWQLSPQPPLPIFSRGTGEPDDPYLVSTANELNYIGHNPRLMSAHFQLTSDIDLAGIDFYIIGSQAYPFDGIFNGNGHTISNFSYTATHANNIGLFGYVKGENAVIRDLGLIAPETSGKHAVGSLIGELNYGILSGCYTEGGSVTSDWSGGGLVGGNNYGTITNCYATSSVFGSGINYWQGVGGLLGYNSYGSITNCYTEGGSVSGYRGAGGLVGGNSGSISNCYSTDIVTGSSYDVGGLVGTSFWGSIADCYSTGSVVGYGNVGGLVGFNERGAIIVNCYATGNVSSNRSVGGLVGFGGSVYSSCWDTQTSGLSTSSGGIGKTTAEMQMANTFIGWANNPVWTIDEGKDYPRLWWENMPGKPITTASPFENVAGAGTETDPYLIYTTDELNIIRRYPYEWDKHFKLMSDIDLSIYTGESFEIIGRYGWPFTGVFDGNGHTISNFTYTSTSWNYVGFFGCVKEGTIKNLGLIYPNVGDGMMYEIGSLVGYLQMGVIKNCYAKSGNVAGQEHVGGLVGVNSSGIITSSYATSSVTGNIETGGLVGENSSGTIMNCYTNGIVSGDWCIGGLVGINSSGTITNSYAASSVSGDYWSVSGLVGENSGSITSCFWNIETIEQITSEGGIELTTTEMQVAGTFLEAGWDFVDETANGAKDIWWINEGQDYPKLWWQLGQLSAFSPNPRNGIKELIQPTILSWKSVESTASHDVYLSQDANAIALATIESGSVYRGRLPAQETFYERGRLEFTTTYYWRIDEVNETDPGNPCKGDIWSFTTAGPVSHPDPEDNGTSNVNSTVLSWVPGSTVLHYDLYFGEDEEAVGNATPESINVYVGRQSSERTSFEPGNLKPNKTYYWRVDAVDPIDPSNIWKGDVWKFTTISRSRIIID